MKILTMNSVPATIRSIFFNSSKRVVAVRLFGFANSHTLKKPLGILYADEFLGDDDTVLRDWDDISCTGETYSAQEFLKDIKLWGVNLEDSIDGEDAISIYVYREDMPE